MSRRKRSRAKDSPPVPSLPGGSEVSVPAPQPTPSRRAPSRADRLRLALAAILLVCWVALLVALAATA